MSILNKIKGFFFNQEEKQEGESQQVNSNTSEQCLSTPPADPQGNPTGMVCDYCQMDIYDSDKVRTVANKKLHKRCAKKLMKQAKQHLWGN